MDFLLSPELKEFASSLERFLHQYSPIETLHQRTIENNKSILSSNTVKNSALWKSLTDLGVFAAGIKDSSDGLGLGISSLSIIGQLLGGSPLVSPVVETLFYGVDLISTLASLEHAAELQPQIAEGKLVCTAASQHLYKPSITNLKVSIENNKSALLSGEFDFVPFFAAADILLIPIADPALLLAVKLPCKTGLISEEIESIDLLRPYSRLKLNNLKADILSAEINASQVMIAALRVAALASTEMLGAASRALLLSCDYAKTRKQFGKPIGSFQAIAHKLANMQVKVASAEALTRFALWASEEDKESFKAAALAAKCFTSQEMPKVCEEAIQVHGGIGFTYEYALHFYLRRVRSLATLFGDSSHYARALSELRLS